MTTQVGSVGTTSSTASTASASSTSSSSSQKLTDETKQKLQALGVDTTSITTEMQGQIALLQAQQQQQILQAHCEGKSGNGKAEMDSIKSQAVSLAEKLGINVLKDEKLSDIMAVIGPALDAKVLQAGNDKTKLAEVQALQSEYNSLSSSLSKMEAQRSQQAQSSSSQSSASLSSNLSNIAAQNKLYHQV